MTSGVFKKAVTSGVVGLALVLSFLMYWRYSTKPWTRDAQVQANVVGIAPRVEGPVINFPVKDNQVVKKGDLLFEIDPSTYVAARDKAAAALKQSQAAQIQAKQELDRQTTLFEQKVTDVRDLQNAQDTFLEATANVAAAQAGLASAELNLGFTKSFAPVDGYLTNVNTSVGTYVAVGQQLLALVDGSSFWVAANFKETQLHQVAVGDVATIRLMGYGNAPFEGTVQGVAWGIFQSDGATVDLLPNVSQTVDWVRLPNRFPVRIHVNGSPPVPLRIGQTASVAITKEKKED
jgi:RND family efflux transporter MFP subunit